MNIENFKKLRELLAQIEDAEFDMADFGYDTPCGTCYCLGGWATILAGATFIDADEGFVLDGETVDAEIEGRKFLGLTKDEAVGMFFPGLREKITLPNAMKSTREDAIEYLDNCIRTGSVWAREHQ